MVIKNRENRALDILVLHLINIFHIQMTASLEIPAISEHFPGFFYTFNLAKMFPQKGMSI